MARLIPVEQAHEVLAKAGVIDPLDPPRDPVQARFMAVVLTELENLHERVTGLEGDLEDKADAGDVKELRRDIEALEQRLDDFDETPI